MFIKTELTMVAFLRISLTFLFCCTSVLIFPQDNPKGDFSFKWDNGFKLESADKNFKLGFGGRLMIDHAAFWQNDDLEDVFGPLETEKGMEIRRARMYFSGTVYNNVEFKFNFDVAGGEIGIKDMYIGIKNLPGISSLRIGNVKEPLRLSSLTSSKYITFMERPFHTDFVPMRNNGVLILTDFHDKRISAQAGFFRNASNGDDVFANDGYVLTGRISGLPVQNSDNTNLIHLGASYSYRKPSLEEFHIDARPEAHLSSEKYLNTGLMENVRNINLFNLEAAFVANSLTAQVEYTRASVKGTTDYDFSTIYGQASYFITGESRIYKSSYSGFGRIKPKRNFIGKGSGPGAWELALRYSYANLNHGDVLGGREQNLNFGVNWYLNPVSRVMFNYAWADVIDAGNLHILQMRVQVDF